MELVNITPMNFNSNIFHLWDKKWFLLTSGDFEKNEFNTMTVAWGSFGIMWNKPFAQIVVRPTRHTYNFTEKYDTFTLTAFPEDYKTALKILGSKSGRDGDKIAEAGLTPVASQLIAAPSFKEAELHMECKKIYHHKFEPSDFLDGSIDKNYPGKDYHKVYFGEIVNIMGIAAYANK
ncbi:MAG: flavin reductase [Bacteroidetes bacterium]|nr:flavin reductase [Bacteroidota bacterium]